MMTVLVELPLRQEASGAERRTVWVNPDHVVAVESSVAPGHSWVSTPTGQRFHVALEPAATADALRVRPFAERQDDVDLRESVMANLRRERRSRI